ncbi:MULTISPECIES: DUF4198 domain-containing protein [Desulfobacula]|nr:MULTISPECIES: DUF4198 domain-containing protein [Desulfobacula]SDU29427.1 protein of unknown function [Desulfobacula phenolica]
MNKKSIMCFTLIAALIFSTNVFAHSLWVNLNESFSHPPGHVISSLGWGHSVPMDDFLMSKGGAVTIERYDLVGPDNSKTAMPLPVIKQEKVFESKTGMNIVTGDLGLRKISLTEDTQPGTYQVIAESKATFFTGYVDKNGKVKMTTKPMDKIKGAKKFNYSTRYKAVAKSYMGIKKWTQPMPAGHELELMPTCDLSNVRAGGIVSFEASLNGKKLNCDMDGMNYLLAKSNTYGVPDGFMLSAYIMDGKARVRIPTAGEWVVIVMVQKEVTPENELKDLVGKCTMVHYGATVSMNVKP